ncbi:MAG: hypothetical protein H6581_30385 [Bacteroidia bacterium]|nr:hypothetical protein [Bacteroidia bacterium]
MKQKAIIFPLVLIFLAIMVKPFAPYIEYKINQKTIVSKFCINKTRPSLKCNGKCYLSRQLKLAAEQEKAPKAPLQLKKIEWVVAVFPERISEKEFFSCKNVVSNQIRDFYQGIDLPPPTPPPPLKG